MAKRAATGKAKPGQPSKRKRATPRAAAPQRHGKGPAEHGLNLLAWPLREKDEKVPQELFQQVCTSLPRSDINSMRLVCKMFELMISPHLFRCVVVPFKAGIYRPEIDIAGLHNSFADGSKRGDVMIKDEGMRVFAGYGEHIAKFAMSFEYDEEKLTNPPVKTDQVAITSYWGIYRWPHEEYNRDAQLAHLETIADETNSLSAALQFITKANTLGLSIDSGLGWLSGPDANTIYKAHGHAYKVFGRNRFVPEPLKQIAEDSERNLPVLGLADMSLDDISRAAALETKSMPPVYDSEDKVREVMLRATGLEGEELYAAIVLMRKTENPSEEETDPQLSELPPSPVVSQSLDPGSSRVSSVPDSDRVVVAPVPRIVPANPPRPRQVRRPFRPIRSPYPTSEEKAAALDACLLKPRNLTVAQKEVLLETMWAQQAFVQSYVISITDNTQVFSKVATLTIARIPDHFLQDLDRVCFWDTLSGLEKLHLGVIPSWRQIRKLPTGIVVETEVAPSSSMEAVYNLLDNQISRRKNIKTLCFEWIGGGEEAPGKFARNYHVLPAPVVSSSNGMLNRKVSHSILALPYVKQLTLKNCWFSPHILESFLEGFDGGKDEDLNLQSLVFDSVSLSVPVPADTSLFPDGAPLEDPQVPDAPPLPALQAAVAQAGAQAGAQAAAANAHFQINAAIPAPAAGAAVPAVAAGGPAGGAGNADDDNGDNNISEPLEEEKYLPRPGSWLEIIEQLTPSHYRSLCFRKQESDDADTEPLLLNLPLISSLRSLEFHSCGYVRLNIWLEQDVIMAPSFHQLERTHQIAFQDAMMSSNDCDLGTIINDLNNIERWQLVNGYFLQLGWKDLGDYLTRLAEAREDLVEFPGRGRFSGKILATDVKP